MSREPFTPTGEGNFHRRMHGYRVMFGGQKGVLNRCFSKTTRRFYWKVRLKSGAWIWPEACFAESTGHYTAHCTECPLRFLTDSPLPHGLCPNCVRRIEAEAGPAYDPDAEPGHVSRRRLRYYKRSAR